MNGKSLEVHLPSLSLWYSTRNNLQRTTPVIGLLRPKVDLTRIRKRSDRIAAIHKAIRWLNVEQRMRYIPASGKTYCNIYAYDLAHMLGGYIPRVWWKPEVIPKIIRGEKVDIIYGKTVSELNANAIADWLLQYGSFFDWKRYADLSVMQNSVNNGRLGFIVAKAKEAGRRGHITAVIPETGWLSASKQNSVIVSPLQSQAGAQNIMYFSDAPWWADAEQFQRFYFWVWDI